MMKMNEKWRTYWTSDITEDDCNIMLIEKTMTLIYIMSESCLNKLISESQN